MAGRLEKQLHGTWVYYPFLNFKSNFRKAFRVHKPRPEVEESVYSLQKDLKGLLMVKKEESEQIWDLW